jgi:hypothetical protein
MSHLIRTTTAVLLLSAALPAPAQTYQATTWVSGVGDDANPGTRFAPCKTLAGAYALTLPGGVIKTLDPGGFGALTIGRPITLQGGPGMAGILAVPGTTALTVNLPSGGQVVIRNLALNGAGGAGTRGITCLGSGRLVVEHCRIYGFATGISVQGTGQVVLRDVTITSADGGIGVETVGGSPAVSLDGVAVQGGATGIHAASGTLQVTGSVLAMATGAGILAEGGTVSARGCLVTGNGVGARASSGAIRLSGCDLFENTVELAGATACLVSAGDNRAVNGSPGLTPGGAMTLK